MTDLSLMHSLLIKNAGFDDLEVYKRDIMTQLENLSSVESPKIQNIMLSGLV